MLQRSKVSGIWQKDSWFYGMNQGADFVLYIFVADFLIFLTQRHKVSGKRQMTVWQLCLIQNKKHYIFKLLNHAIRYHAFLCKKYLDIGYGFIYSRSVLVSRAEVAQSVEQGTENPRVGGSIPSLGILFKKAKAKKRV